MSGRSGVCNAGLSWETGNCKWKFSTYGASAAKMMAYSAAKKLV